MSSMTERGTIARTVWQYWLVSYVVLLVNAASYLRMVSYEGWITPFFAGTVCLSYAAIYLLPALLIPMAVLGILSIPAIGRLMGRMGLRLSWVVLFVAVVMAALIQVLLLADKWIFHLFGFHLNGFVWNLVTTKGGVESMGGDAESNLTFALIIASLVVVQVVLLVVVLKVGRVRRFLDVLSHRWVIIAFAVIVGLSGTFERVTYGVSHFRAYSPVLLASQAFPFYQPTRFSGLARSLGFKVKREPSISVNVRSSDLRYPLNPIHRQPQAKPLNIIMLVAESWRGDMLDPRIMPKTWALAQKSNWFLHHYSGGNGTRMAMFSMFYGLYGPYWFSFLEQNRGPVLMDTLVDAGYQIKALTSAKFTYPEFDRTIFARLSAKQMHEGTLHPKWRRDRENVDLMLDFIERRDPARPFMTFLFFESTHAKYYFPPEAVIETSYAEDLNYATMDLQKNMAGIKARYINASRHLDILFDQIVRYLTEKKLLDSTVLLITGDHGEEFMEKGHWGHASTFNDYQTITPLVLWVPGRPPIKVEYMTSHMDIPPTLMSLLGVTNLPQDYSMGYDLLSSYTRDFILMSEWNSVVYVDKNYKAEFPVSSYDFSRVRITTRDDQPVQDRSAFYERNTQRIGSIMRNAQVFGRRGNAPRSAS